MYFISINQLVHQFNILSRVFDFDAGNNSIIKINVVFDIFFNMIMILNKRLTNTNMTIRTFAKCISSFRCLSTVLAE